MSKIALLISIICFFLIQLACTQEIHIPPKTHPDVKNWKDLFKSDLSNAIFPEGVWTNENEILTASEDKVIWSQKS